MDVAPEDSAPTIPDAEAAADRVSTIVATDPLRRFDRFGALVLAVRKILPADRHTQVTPSRTGYNFRTRFLLSVSAVLLRLGLCLPTRRVECVVRGVPTAVSTPELVEDLELHLGAGGVKIRRLHQHTGGRVDRERPISAIVVSLPEDQLAQLKLSLIHI